MKTNVTTLVKSVFAHHQAAKGHIAPQEVAIKHFGASSAVAQMMASKASQTQHRQTMQELQPVSSLLAW